MAREIDKDGDIRRQRRSHDVERAVADLAARQEGVADRDQLIRLGLTVEAIDHRVRIGRLHVIHRGVYAVGHRRLTRTGLYRAAVLFAGGDAVLSHRAAADLWELRASKEQVIDVTVPTDRRGDAIVQIHPDRLDPSETMIVNGIRVTNPLPTLLDLAAVVDEKELERAIRQAIYRRLTTTTLLAEAVQKRRGLRGAKALRKALINLGEAPGLTRSVFEEAFVEFLRKHRLPMPELNAEMRIHGKGIEVDCTWVEKRLITELDGRDAHHSLPAFESDRARDAALLAAGWRVLRVTSRRMRQDGDRLADELRALLA